MDTTSCTGLIECYFGPANLPGYAQALATLVAVGFAYFFGIRQLHKENRLQRRAQLQARRADALQAAWQLLGWMSYTENENSVLRYTRKRHADGTSTDTWYLQHANAYRFIEQVLPQVFYQQNAGIHWPQPVRDTVYEYRNTLHRLWLACDKPETQGETAITNPEVVPSLRGLYDKLNKLLREEIDKVYD